MNYEPLQLKTFNQLSPLQKTWCNYLDEFQFNVFGTHTTRRPITMKSSRKLAEKFFDTFSGIDAFFFACEPFDTREGFHFHSLIKSGYDANTFQSYWDERYGRGRFDYIKGQSGVQAYVTKYITKTTSDYDLLTKKPLY